MDTLTRLEDTIAQRRRADPETSYVASLSARGLPVIARKFREELVGEAADVLFHLLVMLAEKDVSLADVMAELDRREGVSGLEEKANRTS